MLAEDAQNLSITAVVFSSLCALYGVYFVLFLIAIWSTFRQPGKSYKYLRIVTVLLFVDLGTHFIARSLQFSQARIIPQPSNELLRWSIPLLVVEGITSTLAGLLSDGLLAWRFYIIYDRQRWAFYTSVAALLITALLGLSSNLQHLSIYNNPNFYEDTLLDAAYKISAAWGWIMFVINTLLTGSILGRVLFTARACEALNAGTTSASASGRMSYNTVSRAIVESALVTWVGLLLYEIATVAPTQGHITTKLNLGYVMICILPFFFGISQCLITARLGLAAQAREAMNSQNSVGAGRISFAADPEATPPFVVHMKEDYSSASEGGSAEAKNSFEIRQQVV